MVNKSNQHFGGFLCCYILGASSVAVLQKCALEAKYIQQYMMFTNG